jgi:hypothetical protein
MPSIRIILLLYLGITINAFGQLPSYELQWGQELRYREVNAQDIVDMDSTSFYTTGSRFAMMTANRWYFAKYNRQTSSQDWQVEMEQIIFEGDRTELLSTHVVKGEFYIFLQAYNRQQDEKILLLQILDTNGDPKEIRVVERMDARTRNKGNFTISFSQNREKFVIFSSPDFSMRDVEKFSMAVYNLDLELLWAKDVELDILDRYFQLVRSDVTNEGAVYFMGKKTPERNKGERWVWGASNEEFLVYRVDGDEDDLYEVDLGLDLIWVTNMGMELDFGNNTMAIAGFYSEQGYNRSSMKGMIYITLNQDDASTVSTHLEPFPTEFLDEFMTTGRAQRGNEIREDFVFRHFLHRPDGGAFVIAEDYEMQVVTSQTRNGTVTNYYYYYYDIIAFGISDKGQIEWSGHIPKRQFSRNDGGRASGYLPVVDGNQLHVLFNDHKGNEKRFGRRIPSIMRNPVNSNLVAVTITPEAEMTYNVLYNNAKTKVLTLPKRSVSSEFVPGDAVFFSFRRNKIQFGSLQRTP